MIEIRRMTLRLPAGYGDRAARIARQIAHEIAHRSIATSGTIERISAGPVHVGKGRSDRVVAQAVADSVIQNLNETRGGSW